MVVSAAVEVAEIMASATEEEDTEPSESAEDRRSLHCFHLLSSINKYFDFDVFVVRYIVSLIT